MARTGAPKIGLHSQRWRLSYGIASAAIPAPQACAPARSHPERGARRVVALGQTQGPSSGGGIVGALRASAPDQPAGTTVATARRCTAAE